MKTIIKKIFSFPFYPIAFGAYPALALLAENMGQVNFDAAIRSILVSMAVSAILFVALRLVTRDWRKAAITLLLWLVVFFFYGHVYATINEKYPDFNLTPWALIIAWILLIGLTIVALKTSPSAEGWNAIALGLVIYSIWQVNLKSAPRDVHALGSEKAPIQNDLARPTHPPDVYYIILDMYTRQDLLAQAYKYDNSGFIRELEKRGFYVAQCSQSNYVRTELSLGSSLNMQYLPELNDTFTPDNIGRLVLWDSLKHGAVRYNFESMGYKTINFATGFAWNELTDADRFISPPAITSGLSDFEGLFLRATMARHAQDWGWIDAELVSAQIYRDRFNSIFDNMDNMARMSEPTFAYIHVISPHPPFVYDANGNETYPPDYWNEQRLYPSNLFRKGYIAQLRHLNKKILEAIDTLQSESETPPIIILQGDHGPWMQPRNNKFWILNAYYLPGHAEKLYPTISPVNTFRLIFDEYFGGKYDMLKDESYYSPVPNLYKFSAEPYPCNSK